MASYDQECESSPIDNDPIAVDRLSFAKYRDYRKRL